MKLLCTADLHLKADQSESVKILDWILARAEEMKIDYVLIAGDLFDSMSDFRELKGEAEEIFNGIQEKMEIIAVPGNHDQQICPEDHLGKNVTVLDENTSPAHIGKNDESMEIFGLPYRKGKVAARQLNDFETDDLEEPTLLLTHGSLIEPGREYIIQDLQEQEEDNSFVFFTKDFADRNFDAVVLGHWHRGDVFTSDGTTFVYPGSTLPQSKRELGPKSFVVMEAVPGETFSFSTEKITHPESWYYRRENLFTLPGLGGNPQSQIKNLLDENKDGRCHLILDINGFLTDISETKFRDLTKETVSKFEDDYHHIEINWETVSDASLQGPLVENFMEEAENIELDEEITADLIGSLESDIRPYFRQEIEKNPNKLKNLIMETGLKVLSDRLEG